MEIIYVSNLIAEKKMNDIINNSKSKPLQSIQKFHRLVCKGIVCNNIKVRTISAIPMSSKISNKKVWHEKKEIEDNIEYRYLPFINIRIIRQLCLLIFTAYYVIKECIHNKKEKIFICDLLDTTISTITLLLTRLFKVKCTAIVTDLPRDIGTEQSLSRKINQFLQNKYDAYIFLTQQMSEVINKNKKPYLVIEGIANSEMLKYNRVEKYSEKVCIYAGGLYAKYGVACLIDAFLQLKKQDIRLHIYGDGELVQKIKDIKDERIKYFGVVTNQQVVAEEIKATLLINPRFTKGEYTKYSFPSKIMEYMSTGTPVLTTRLEGMPKEYLPYVYLFEEESLESYKDKLEEILEKPKEELERKGEQAKKFVLTEKSEKIQGEKIVNFMKREIITK